MSRTHGEIHEYGLKTEVSLPIPSLRRRKSEVAFADHHSADFQRMVQEASGSYLFAISCFNVSHMLAPRRFSTLSGWEVHGTRGEQDGNRLEKAGEEKTMEKLGKRGKT